MCHNREMLFRKAGQLVVDLCKRWYDRDDASVLPRTIASFDAFENVIALDIAMGGSTNTVLHLLAAAQEAGVGFTMADIDRMSRKVPCLAKVAPATQKYHMEDVHRAGGIMAILGELARAGLLAGRYVAFGVTHVQRAAGQRPDAGTGVQQRFRVRFARAQGVAADHASHSWP